jgi:choline monooxygenase
MLRTMTGIRLEVGDDVSTARTPPAEMYRDPAWFAALAERVLARSWHWIGDESLVPDPKSSAPVELALGAGSESVLLVRDERGRVGCLSNVCTHRGNVLSREPARGGTIRCGYHGRCFGLDGRVVAAPGFEGAVGFPSAEDALPRVPSGRFRGHLFAGAQPRTPFASWIATAEESLAWAPLESMRFDATSVVDHHVDAHWALYVENYLEGYHVPYVHAGLAREVDVDAYETRLLEHGVLQVGFAGPGEASAAFRPPVCPPRERRPVAAWWLWLFPATMLNVYPWGISVNAVQALSPTRTRIRFASYVLDESRRAQGAGGDLSRVEAEDEAVVNSVQRGIRSRFYRTGRYSPAHERGVHRFHRMLAESLAD